jgi:hypothetical protein
VRVVGELPALAGVDGGGEGNTKVESKTNFSAGRTKRETKQENMENTASQFVAGPSRADLAELLQCLNDAVGRSDSPNVDRLRTEALLRWWPKRTGDLRTGVRQWLAKDPVSDAGLDVAITLFQNGIYGAREMACLCCARLSYLPLAIETWSVLCAVLGSELRDDEGDDDNDGGGVGQVYAFRDDLTSHLNWWVHNSNYLLISLSSRSSSSPSSSTPFGTGAMPAHQLVAFHDLQLAEELENVSEPKRLLRLRRQCAQWLGVTSLRQSSQVGSDSARSSGVEYPSLIYSVAHSAFLSSIETIDYDEGDSENDYLDPLIANFIDRPSS